VERKKGFQKKSQVVWNRRLKRNQAGAGGKGGKFWECESNSFFENSDWTAIGLTFSWYGEDTCRDWSR